VTVAVECCSRSVRSDSIQLTSCIECVSVVYCSSTLQHTVAVTVVVACCSRSVRSDSIQRTFRVLRVFQCCAAVVRWSRQLQRLLQ